MALETMGVTFQYSHTIGRMELLGSGFLTAVAMARGAGDRMYVINRSLHFRPDGIRVTMLTVGEEYIGDFGKGVANIGEEEGDYVPDGCLVWPAWITLDSKHNVSISDEWLNRISIFTEDGGWIGKWGTPGTGDGELDHPAGIHLDKEDNLYVVDSLNHRVQKFTRKGKFLAKWGRYGSGEGEFNMPWGIEIDKDGYVYVADWRNDRIQKFTPDGQFVMALGSSGEGDGEFKRPTAVAVDGQGIIYVADWGNNRVQIFGPDGAFITALMGEATISKWGQDKLEANAYMFREREIAQGLEREKLFWAPVCVEVDEQDRLFVVEGARCRVQVYRKQYPTFYSGRL